MLQKDAQIGNHRFIRSHNTCTFVASVSQCSAVPAHLFCISVFLVLQGDFLSQLDVAYRETGRAEKRATTVHQIKRANRALLLDYTHPYSAEQIEKVRE